MSRVDEIRNELLSLRAYARQRWDHDVTMFAARDPGSPCAPKIVVVRTGSLGCTLRWGEDAVELLRSMHRSLERIG